MYKIRQNTISAKFDSLQFMETHFEVTRPSFVNVSHFWLSLATWLSVWARLVQGQLSLTSVATIYTRTPFKKVVKETYKIHHR